MHEYRRNVIVIVPNFAVFICENKFMSGNYNMFVYLNMIVWDKLT